MSEGRGTPSRFILVDLTRARFLYFVLLACNNRLTYALCGLWDEGKNTGRGAGFVTVMKERIAPLPLFSVHHSFQTDGRRSIERLSRHRGSCSEKQGRKESRLERRARRSKTDVRKLTRSGAGSDKKEGEGEVSRRRERGGGKDRREGRRGTNSLDFERK